MLILGGYCLLCVGLALHLHYYPSQVERTDAWEYVKQALEMRDNGLFGKLSSWRTYGYIWFLYFCSLLFGTGRQALAWGAAAVQAVLYAATVFYLSAAVREHSARLARAIEIGLLLNPILVALVLDVLTESLTLSSAVLLLALLLHACRAPTFVQKVPWLVAGAALASFALMVRPANLSLLVGWNAAVLSLLWSGSARSTSRAVLVYAMIATAAAAVAWLPQLIITGRHFGQASIFPATALGDFQLAMGLKLLKYATTINDNLGAGMFYPNPWLTNVPDTPPLWQWYLDNPIAGALTAASHIFNALNYDHPFVYVYDTSLPYATVLAFIIWSLYALGAIDIASATRRQFAESGKRREFFPSVLFLAMMTAVSLATITVSAVESRFSTLILAMVGVFACHRVSRLKELPAVQRSWLLGISFIVGICGTLISEWMKSLMTLTQPA